MKKFFAIAVIAVAMAACNNGSETTTTEDSSTIKPVDTTVVAPVDTTHVDTTTAKKDTTAKK